MDKLTVIMRSLGMSPTIAELRAYMKDKGGKMAFADFLDVMHTHSKKESIPRELPRGVQELRREEEGRHRGQGPLAHSSQVGGEA